MKIRYKGRDPKDTSLVDVVGVADGVAPGDVINVPADVANRLLMAGAACSDSGDVEPAAWPLWVPAGKNDDTPATAETPTADASPEAAAAGTSSEES